jgi:hypothetical protein
MVQNSCLRISWKYINRHLILSYYAYIKGRRRHDRMVVGIMTTYAISAYHR